MISILVLQIFLWAVSNLYEQSSTSNAVSIIADDAGISKINVGNAPGSVEAADFNGDQAPDLAITSETDSSVTILLGDGKGGFSPASRSPFFVGPIPNDIAVGDLNKDGIPDLVFSNHEKKYISVLIGDGNGNFAPAKNSPFRTEGIPHVHGVALGDYNNDGWLDIVTDSWGNNQVEVLFGDNQLLFGKHRRFFRVGQRPYQRLRSADLNADGMADIVTTNSEGNNASVLLADRKGGFNEPIGSPFPCGDDPFGVAIGDLNADGSPDLAIINSPSSMAEGSGKNGLTILINDGKGKFTTFKGSPFDAGANPNRVAVGDVGGDRSVDIVTSDFEGNKIYLFSMKNGNVISNPIITGRHPKGVAIADLNKDGRGDIVVCNNGDNTIAIVWGK